MNVRDLKVMCKEIKGFDSLNQWQIIGFIRTLYGSLFMHLPSAATFNHSIREKYFHYAIFVEAVKITLFYT